MTGSVRRRVWRKARLAARAPSRLATVATSPASHPSMVVRLRGSIGSRWHLGFADGPPAADCNDTLPQRKELRLGGDLTRLPAQHGALAGDAPMVASDIAGFADDAMTGDHE